MLQQALPGGYATPIGVQIKNYDGSWFSGGRNSLVVVDARSPRFNSLGVMARF